MPCCIKRVNTIYINETIFCQENILVKYLLCLRQNYAFFKEIAKTCAFVNSKASVCLRTSTLSGVKILQQRPNENSSDTSSCFSFFCSYFPPVRRRSAIWMNELRPGAKDGFSLNYWQISFQKDTSCFPIQVSPT